MLKTQRVHRYIFHVDGGDTQIIDFIPMTGCPGFSHRVARNGQLTSKWLGDSFSPSETSALDMLDMLLEEWP